MSAGGGTSTLRRHVDLEDRGRQRHAKTNTHIGELLSNTEAVSIYLYIFGLY